MKLNWIIGTKWQCSKPINSVQTINYSTWICVQIELLVLDNNTCNYLAVSKQMRSSSFKNVTNKLFAYKLYIYVCVCVCVWVCGSKKKSWWP